MIHIDVDVENITELMHLLLHFILFWKRRTLFDQNRNYVLKAVSLFNEKTNKPIFKPFHYDSSRLFHL